VLSNNLIIVRNHGDDEEHEQDIKRALEREGDTHIKVEIRFRIPEFDFESNNSQSSTTSASN
jgi:hypothetical protein